jgi:hypothetical protein
VGRQLTQVAVHVRTTAGTTHEHNGNDTAVFPGAPLFIHI